MQIVEILVDSEVVKSGDFGRWHCVVQMNVIQYAHETKNI